MLATKEKFLNPEQILTAVPLRPGMIVADFGAGNGHYAAAAGKLVGKKGQVWAMDIMEDALSQTATLAKLEGLHNVSTRLCDLEKYGSCPVPEMGADLVIMSGLLHQAQDKDAVLREAYRVLKTGGLLLVTEWRPDAPFGPSAEVRLAPQQTRALLEQSGFRPSSELAAGSFHYALVYEK